LFSFDGLSVACTCFIEFGCDELTYGLCFETLLNQGLVMAKDTCETTITKRLAWLVELLIVSSYEFSFSFYFILDIQTKITKIISSMFPTFSYFIVLFSFHFLFFFLFILSNIEEPLTYTWTYR